MQIKTIENSTDWNDGALPFAQSWEWGEILAKEGKKVLRLAVFEGDKLLAKAQVAVSPVIFGWKYAFCPKGPVFYNESGVLEVKSGIIKELAAYLKSEKIFFLRLEPKGNIAGGALRKSIDINPRATLLVDLAKPEEELLNAMHSKTRYNIRLAEKKELNLKWEKNLAIFYKLMSETGRRDNFKLHHKDHYRHIFESNLSSQLTIYQKDEPVAVGVFIGSGDTFTYLYGASSYYYRQLMAPYLVQWEGIKKGKELGYKLYDFFGVAPKIKNNSKDYNYEFKHQYAGVTRFKLGFGGFPREDAGTFDCVIDKTKYSVYQILRDIRRFF